MKSACQRIIVACDSFKGTMTAVEVCKIIRDAVLSVAPEADVVCIPVADGGEGTVDCFFASLGGKIMNTKVKSPLLNTVNAYWLMTENKTAVIEAAQASGINTDSSRDALRASSYGTGELIKNALDCGATEILVGLGGSATTDAGTGLLSALGARFLDQDGNEVPSGGSGLACISSVDVSGLDSRLKSVKLTALCDVINPLYGKNGAAFVFSPQKGASLCEVEILDGGLRRLSEVCRKCGIGCVSDAPGAGAAGGIGFGLMTFAQAKLRSGIDAVLDLSGFDELSEGAAVVITGEGKLDGQSFGGKVPSGVARRSRAEHNIAVVGLCEADEKDIHRIGIEKVFESNVQHRPFEEIKDSCRMDLFSAAVRASKAFLS